MKLGEIKIAVLAMIFPEEIFEADYDNEDSLRELIFNLRQNPNYSDMLANMPLIINRCFSSLLQKSILPTKEHEIDSKNATKMGDRLKINVESKMSKIERIAFYNDKRYEPRVSYVRQSTDTILLPDWHGTFVIVYANPVNRISPLTGDNYEIDLPDDICELIPYFVKSELLRSEDPDEASVTRNIYEQLIEEIVSDRTDCQLSVENTYQIDLT
ncbi:MAG: hypothetical protein IJW54_05910 [Clostridia bacterium]|nr:hypothetical protein [Clostridia bacterium]